jgi:ABC-2 type transport system permease protein
MGGLILHELRARWKSILGWTLGLIALGATYIGVWPSAADEMASLADIEIYALLGIQMQTFEGYIGSVIVQFVPVLLGIYAILVGTRTLAGEEDRGTLELVLAQPIRRWQIVSIKTLSIALSMAVIVVLSGLGNAAVFHVIRDQIDTQVTPMQLFTSVLSGWPISMAFAMISLFLGALLPTRRLASMVAAVVVIASYFAETLTGFVSSLEAVEAASLFTYFDSGPTVFTEGVKWGDMGILLGVGAVFYLLALLAFHGRNVTVGAWPWTRNRAPG